VYKHTYITGLKKKCVSVNEANVLIFLKGTTLTPHLTHYKKTRYARLGDPNCNASVEWLEVPERCGVPGCSDRGSRVLVLNKPHVPQVRVVCRRKAADSYFKVCAFMTS
jgi:hypothetical protein